MIGESEICPLVKEAVIATAQRATPLLAVHTGARSTLRLRCIVKSALSYLEGAKIHHRSTLPNLLPQVVVGTVGNGLRRVSSTGRPMAIVIVIVPQGYHC